VICAVAPAASVASAQVTRRVPVHVSCDAVAETSTDLAGSRSVTSASVASTDERFRTTSVYVSGWPTVAGRGAALSVRPRSASEPTMVATESWLFHAARSRSSERTPTWVEDAARTRREDDDDHRRRGSRRKRPERAHDDARARAAPLRCRGRHERRVRRKPVADDDASGAVRSRVPDGQRVRHVRPCGSRRRPADANGEVRPRPLCAASATDAPSASVAITAGTTAGLHGIFSMDTPLASVRRTVVPASGDLAVNGRQEDRKTMRCPRAGAREAAGDRAQDPARDPGGAACARPGGGGRGSPRARAVGALLLLLSGLELDLARLRGRVLRRPSS